MSNLQESELGLHYGGADSKGGLQNHLLLAHTQSRHADNNWLHLGGVYTLCRERRSSSHEPSLPDAPADMSTACCRA